MTIDPLSLAQLNKFFYTMANCRFQAGWSMSFRSRGGEDTPIGS